MRYFVQGENNKGMASKINKKIQKQVVPQPKNPTTQYPQP